MRSFSSDGLIFCIASERSTWLHPGQERHQLTGSLAALLFSLESKASVIDRVGSYCLENNVDSLIADDVVLKTRERHERYFF